MHDEIRDRFRLLQDTVKIRCGESARVRQETSLIRGRVMVAITSERHDPAPVLDRKQSPQTLLVRRRRLDEDGLGIRQASGVLAIEACGVADADGYLSLGGATIAE